MTDRVDLDSPLVAVAGRAVPPTLLAAQLDIAHGRRPAPPLPAPLRRPRAAHRHRRAWSIGEHVTLVAQVEKATLRDDARPAAASCSPSSSATSRAAGSTARSSTATSCSTLVKPGVRAVFSGKVGVFNKKLQLTHPQFEPLDEDDELRPFLSVYPATGKLSSQVDRAAACARCSTCSTTRPTRCRPRCASAERLRRAGPGAAPHPRARDRGRHPRRPPPAGVGRGDGRAARARAAPPGHGRPARRRPARRARAACSTAFDARLPFALTDGQKAVGAEIAADLAARHPMNRLVQGDVGAGKTVVALRAMLQVGRRRPAGRDARARPRCSPRSTPARCARCSARWPRPASSAGPSMPPGSRCSPARWAPRPSGRRCSTRSPARPGIVVGTHALIQDRVGFADLGLVVVDEQHRFGVEQRDALRGPRRAGPAHAGHDGHADPAHGRDDRLRRPGGLGAARAARRALADRHHRRAAGREAVLVRAGVAAGARGGRGRPPGLRRVPAGGGDADSGRRGRRRTTPPEEESERTPAAAGRARRGSRSWPRARWRAAAGRAARQAARRREGHGDARVRARRARRAGGHHRDRGRRRRAQRHRHGHPRRRPVRAVPAAPAARPGGARLGAPGCACWSPRCRPPPRPASGSTPSPTPPTASSWPGSTWSCAGRATCSAPLQSGRRSGLRLLSPAPARGDHREGAGVRDRHRRARPRLAAHPGLAALVGQTVGDEERAA